MSIVKKHRDRDTISFVPYDEKTHRDSSIVSFDLCGEKTLEIVVSLTLISIVKTHRDSVFNFNLYLYGEKTHRYTLASSISMMKKPIEILVSLTLISMVKNHGDNSIINFDLHCEINIEIVSLTSISMVKTHRDSSVFNFDLYVEKIHRDTLA